MPLYSCSATSRAGQGQDSCATSKAEIENHHAFCHALLLICSPTRSTSGQAKKVDDDVFKHIDNTLEYF